MDPTPHDLLPPLPARLGVPVGADVDPTAALGVLKDRFDADLAWILDVWPVVRRTAERLVVDRDHHFLDLEVGVSYGDRATLWLHEEDLRRGLFDGMRCDACGSAVPCIHVVAAALALLWRTSDGRTKLERSAWRRVLAPLQAKAREADERGRGFLRVVLHARPEEDPREALDGRLSVQLVPLSKRSGKPLKARRAPRSMAALERKVRGLPAGDRAFARLAEQRRLLGHIQTYRYADSVSVSSEVERLDADAFAALAHVSELHYEERPVTIDAEPWAPTLEIRDAPDGGLHLRWRVRVVDSWPAGPGYVLDEHDRLRPLDDKLPPALLESLGRPLPTVPPEEVDAFVHDFLSRTAAPVELMSGVIEPADLAPAPVLRIREDEKAVATMQARFGYGEAEVAFDEPAPVVELRGADGPRVALRDRDAENRALAQLEAQLPVPYPMRFADEEALYDFLLDVVPELQGWAVYLDDALRARAPRGTARASTRFDSGSDWFDLEVRFQVDSLDVKLADVLRSWREGRRYVKLPDGTFARIPQDWLGQHGAAVEELQSMRRGRKGKLRAHAAPVAADLLATVKDAAEKVAHWRAVAESVRDFDRIPERDPPPALKATLRAYQHRGYRWLTAMRDLGLGVVLADDMGLGKTLQTLALLLDSHTVKGRISARGRSSLVVAPTSVVHNWIEEARRFAPTLKMALHHGSNRGEPPTDVAVVVTSYALLRQDAALLTARKWQLVVLDEAQAIKNPSSQVARTARTLEAKHRVALTGTPIENHLLELYSLFEWLNPGFFGSQSAFRERYAKPIHGNQDEDAMARLRRRIRPFVLRRLKSEVASELPPRQEQVLRCELGPRQRQLYERVRDTYRDSVLNKVRDEGVGRSTIQVLEALMRLRQACCDPRLLPFVEARDLGESAKLELLGELLDEIIDEGHRTLVFSQWPSLLKLVAADLLEAKGVDYLYLDGSTTKRGALQSEWNADDGPPVFLISLKAGGTGLNLTGADHVIHLDPWWNPAVERQATDRAHRIGQTKPVMVYKLVAADTVEEKIIELQARKATLAEAAVDADRMLVDELTGDDLEAVFL